MAKFWEALTNISAHRQRAANEPPGTTGADLHYRGEKLEQGKDLTDEHVERLVALGAIRPWVDKEAGQGPPVTARDMSGKEFPDAPAAARVAPANLTPAAGGQPESTDPQPTGEPPPAPPGAAADPYVTK